MDPMTVLRIERGKRMPDTVNVFDRLNSEYYQLTTAERKVADYVIAHQRDTQFLSISDLAEACGVAEATVSRFCRRLQYKGYNTFKLAVANATAGNDGHTVSMEQASEAGAIAENCRKCYAADADALAQTLSLVRPESVAHAARILSEAQRVLCMGQGDSMIMAMEAAHLFSTAFPGYVAISDAHGQIISSATLTPSDAVLLFSYSGSTWDNLKLLQIAKEQGARTILLTRFPKSPAADYADVILQCGASEAPRQVGTVSARMAQLLLLDILFTEVCRIDGDRARSNRERVLAALEQRRI